MFKAFRISFSLKNTYRVNSLIYSLRQIPIIGKIMVPSSFYNVKGLKTLANILVAIWEIATTFAGKALYLFAAVLGATTLYANVDASAVYVHVLFFLTLVGASMNTYMFNPTNDKYYAMFMMRMDAKVYTLSNYIYQLLRAFIGFLPFVIITGLMAGVSIWICLLFPFFIVASKMVVAWFVLLRYQKTGKYVNENLPPVFTWPIWGVLLAAAYGLPALGWTIPIPVFVGVAAATIVLSVVAAAGIAKFKDYRGMYQQLLSKHRSAVEASKQVARTQSRKSISSDVTLTSHRKGFEYFNEIFIKRHRKILWKPTMIATVISLGGVLVLLIALQMSSEAKEAVNRMLMVMLPYFVIVMYGVNRGIAFTQALFMNCDHSMLTYNFYKEPKNILKLFTIRLREIVKINLLPAIVIGGGLAALLYFSGGTENPLNYAVLVVSIIAMSVFFSVHHLICYYLLQPYNADTEMKSATYKIVSGVTYFVCFALMQVRIDTFIFGVCAIAFCVLYSVIACVLAYKLAPKTFKIRN